MFDQIKAWTAPAISKVGFVGLVFLVCLMGVLSFVAFVGGYQKPVAVIVAVTMFSAVGFISGNLRLFILYALVFVAPLPIAKQFSPIPHMGGSSAPGIYAADILLCLLLIYQLKDYFKGRLRSIAIPLPIKFFIVFVLLGLVTVFFGPYRQLAAYEVIRGFQMIFCMVVIANELRSRSRMLHGVTAMMLAVCFQGVFGVAQYIYGKPFGLEFFGEMSKSVAATLSAATLEQGEASFRISALLGHANLLSIYLASQIPIFLGMLFTKTAFWWRTLAATSVSLAAVSLLLTLSRTGWVAAVVVIFGVMVATLFHRRLRPQFIYGRLFFIVAVAAFGTLFSGSIIKRLTKSDSGAVDIRWELMEVAWEMGKSEPILGKGLNSFIYQMPPYTKYKTPAKMTEFFGPDWPVAHNLYAIIWAEQGLIGIILFFLAIGMMAIWALPNAMSRDPVIAVIALGCFLGLVAFTLDWFASFSLRMDTLGRVFSLHIGLFCALELYRRDQCYILKMVKESEALDNECDG